MALIEHKFAGRKISPQSESLIVGTFNPKDGDGDFFYSRSKNYCWQLLPAAFGEASMKHATVAEKEEFCRRRRVDFVDIIQSIDIEPSRKIGYSDKYLNQRANTAEWTDWGLRLDSLVSLKRVCFTRKTFGDVPKIRERVRTLEEYCNNKKLFFKAIISPARFGTGKQPEWNRFFTSNYGDKA